MDEGYLWDVIVMEGGKFRELEVCSMEPWFRY